MIQENNNNPALRSQNSQKMTEEKKVNMLELPKEFSGRATTASAQSTQMDTTPRASSSNDPFANPFDYSD